MLLREEVVGPIVMLLRAGGRWARERHRSAASGSETKSDLQSTLQADRTRYLEDCYALALKAATIASRRGARVSVPVPWDQATCPYPRMVNADMTRRACRESGLQFQPLAPRLGLGRAWVLSNDVLSWHEVDEARVAAAWGQASVAFSQPHHHAWVGLVTGLSGWWRNAHRRVGSRDAWRDWERAAAGERLPLRVAPRGEREPVPLGAGDVQP